MGTHSRFDDDEHTFRMRLNSPSPDAIRDGTDLEVRPERWVLVFGVDLNANGLMVLMREVYTWRAALGWVWSRAELWSPDRLSSRFLYARSELVELKDLVGARMMYYYPVNSPGFSAGNTGHLVVSRIVGDPLHGAGPAPVVACWDAGVEVAINDWTLITQVTPSLERSA